MREVFFLYEALGLQPRIIANALASRHSKEQDRDKRSDELVQALKDEANAKRQRRRERNRGYK